MTNHHVLSNAGVDVYTVCAGAVGALYGPLHGGANEAVLRMLERIGSVDNVGGAGPAGRGSAGGSGWGPQATMQAAALGCCTPSPISRVLS